MKAKRLWPWVVAGIVVVAMGVFTMGTNVGSMQWIIGLVMLIAGVAVLVWTGSPVVGAAHRSDPPRIARSKRRGSEEEGARI